MSALVPITPGQIVLKNFSPDEVAAIEAGKGLRIKEYGLKDLFTRVAVIVKDCVQIKGEKMPEGDMGKLAQLLTEELQTSFGTFTVEEVMQATRSWALGKLSQTLTADEKKREGVHVSVENICKAIWLWRDVTKRQALDKLRKEEEKREIELSEEAKEAGRIQFRIDLQAEFDYWHEHKKLKHSGPTSRAWHAYLYVWFFDRSYGLPNEEAYAIKDKADALIKKEWVDSIHRRDYEIKLEEQRKELAREMALPIVFEKLVKFGIKLEDIK